MVTKTKSEKITDTGRKNIERQKYRNERELLLALVIGQEAILSSSLSQTTINDNFINVSNGVKSPQVSSNRWVLHYFLINSMD